jgi:outer membrane receptor protein involved in Fe transport
MRRFFSLGTFFIALAGFINISLHAQNCVIAGKIVDKQNGEALIGATIQAFQNGNQIGGNVADFDGNYTLEIPAGSYKIEFSYTGYNKIVIETLEVKPGATNTLDAAMETESLQLETVVVTAKTVKNTDASLIAIQRKSFSIQDGVSAQQISRTGSSNAADAMRQMSGAVVEGGRFIVMRGLGDRYSISQLNSVTLPSTDPYRNSASLDLIPSQMIENIITVKTFTPDLPGNFSGGLVNIKTKAFPDKFNLFFQVGSEYNTQSSLINNFNTMQREKGDWLGLNANSREQPQFLKDLSFEQLNTQLAAGNYIFARNPSPSNDAIRNVFDRSAKELSNEFVPTQRTSPTNSSLNFSIGNRSQLFGKELGYTLGVNYSQNFVHYDDGTLGAYRYNNPEALEVVLAMNEQRDTRNPQLGALFNSNLKLSERHILGANVIFNNDAESTARVQRGSFPINLSDPSAAFNVRTLEYTQRQFITYQLTGTHLFGAGKKAELEWVLGATNSAQKEPDLRYFAYSQVGEGETSDFNINNAEFPFPYHFFRDLQDRGLQGKIDFTIPFATRGQANSTNRIKIGGQFNRTSRDFEEFTYQMFNTGIPDEIMFNNYRGDFNRFFDLNNFGIIGTERDANGQITRYRTGYHYVNGSNLRNFYTGAENIGAAYAMAIYNLTPKLKAVGGLRFESTNLEVEARDGTNADVNLGDLLYSVNLIYALNDKSNLRVAASKTLARPNLRELAPFEQFDAKNGFFNVGNTELKRTLIQNFDLRYELYPRSGELLAVSAFFKQFNDPIIRQFNPRATTPELRFINVDEAVVYGVELEFRKKLDVFGKMFENFYFSSNFALIKSSYDVPADEVRASTALFPDYNTLTRPFQGQAPYIANVILSYINPDKGWESSLAFNVSGDRLFNISLFATPDVYEKPFPLLNYKISKRVADNYQLSFTARNLLNATNRRTLEFNQRVYDAESFRVGTGLAFSVAYLIR